MGASRGLEMEDFSALRIAGETYRFLIGHIGALFARGIFAMIAGAGAIIAEFRPEIVHLPREHASLAAAACALLAVQLALHFAVGWHRRILAEPASELEPGERLSLDMAYTRNALGLLVATLAAPVVAALLVAGLGPTVSALAFPAAAFLALVVIGKLCLVLPSAAMGRHRPVSLAWRLSRGIAVKLALLLAMTVLPTSVLAVAVLAGLSSGTAGEWLLGVAGFAVLITVGHAAAVGALSIAYGWRLREENKRWWTHHAR
jgi:hypothetical protein